MTDADMERDGVRLHELCSAIGKSDVVWKKLVIRAERMTWYPEFPESSTLTLRVMNSDGTGLQTILAPAALGLTSLGSPEWSPDGRQIALDVSTGSTTTSKIVVLNADGSHVKDLGPGCMPSFSRDGSRIVMSQPGQGIVMMKSDGTGREVIDRSGWGTQWSPDGKSIAYIKGSNITLLDVETRQSRQLLMRDAATRYSYLYWGLGWSNDGRFIGFKAQRRDDNNSELCVLDVAASELKVLHADANSMAVDFMWAPDNEHLIASLHNPEVQGPQLFSFSRKNPGPLQLFAAQPPHYKSHGYCWSRDGKKIAIASTQIPQPVKWVTGPVEGTSETDGVNSR
jgi:Tol biopolymer transport system component